MLYGKIRGFMRTLKVGSCARSIGGLLIEQLQHCRQSIFRLLMLTLLKLSAAGTLLRFDYTEWAEPFLKDKHISFFLSEKAITYVVIKESL